MFFYIAIVFVKWLLLFTGMYLVGVGLRCVGYDDIFSYFMVTGLVLGFYFADFVSAVKDKDVFHIISVLINSVPIVFSYSVMHSFGHMDRFLLVNIFTTSLIIWIVLWLLHQQWLMWLFHHYTDVFTMYRKRDYVRENYIAYHTDYILNGTFSVYTVIIIMEKEGFD